MKYIGKISAIHSVIPTTKNYLLPLMQGSAIWLLLHECASRAEEKLVSSLPSYLSSLYMWLASSHLATVLVCTITSMYSIYLCTLGHVIRLGITLLCS